MFLHFRNILTVLAIVALIPMVSHGQSIPLGSKSAALGRSSVSLIDIWANNPAGISGFDSFRISAFYESRFLLNELSKKAMAIVYPVNFGSFGLNYQHIGYELYNKQRAGISYSRCFNDKIRTGVRLEYIRVTTGNNIGTSSAITFDIGFQLIISPALFVGGWTYNPVSVNLGNEKLISIYRTGLAWMISPKLILITELEKNTFFRPVICRLGIEYSINNRFHIRSGVSTHSELFSFGMGLELGKLTVNLSSVMHNNLGFSPQAEISFGL